MASYRHLARIAVMQTIFAHEFRGGDPEEILKYNTRDLTDKITDLSFAQNLLNGVLSKKEDIILILQEEAPQWPFDKIAPVDRAILEMGVYEVLFSEDVPAIVAINEAVEIAKDFGDTNSPKFINGVLSTVMHKYLTEEDLKTVRTKKGSSPSKT